jgi:hypothetical protein
MAFVRRNVRRLYGGIPSPSQTYLYAERGRRICGTIALDFADDGRMLPLESLYRIDYSGTPWPFEREKMAQFSKWWVSKRGMGVNLMHAAHAYALEQGKRIGLVEVKPRIVARVAEFGMVLVEVQRAVLLIQGISSRGEGYYAGWPRPTLFMFDILANLHSLRLYLQR